MDTNYIYNGDCLDLCKQLDDNSVDLIIADPPYFEIKGEFDFIWKNVDEYIKWCKKWIPEFKRILKPTGSFYLWGVMGYNKGYALPKIADWIESNELFTVINWITQRNSRGRGNCKKYMHTREELLFMVPPSNITNHTWNTAYTDEVSKRKDLGANGKPRKNTHKRCSDVWVDITSLSHKQLNLWANLGSISEKDLDVWADITEASQYPNQRGFRTSDGEKFETVKALKLCDRIIQASSNENDLVFIPFAGSGSEIISCINNNRNFIASEINPEYIDDIIIAQRINELPYEISYIKDHTSNKYILQIEK